MSLINTFNKIMFSILGENYQSSLNRRIHILITFLTSIILAIGLIGNIATSMNIFADIIALAGLIVSVVFFIIARNSDNYHRSIMPLLILSVVLISMYWFMGAGYDGMTGYLIFVYFLAFYTIVKPTQRKFSFFTFLLLYSALVLIQFIYPDLVLPYDTKEQRFFDFFTGGIVLFIFIYFILDIILKNYASENQKINSINN